MNFQDLPVYRHRQQILDALERSQTIIVESPTGSGKTTQIPLILKEAGYDERGIIGITQPRRIAAVSVCEFIKRQINDTGSYCAYKMRFADTSSRDTRIKIMTDGILLQEVKLDKTLSRYSVIMVDEAHERSLNIDFILGLLKEISEERKDLKIIISSATINASSFSSFFNNAPIITIDSHPYDVEVRYEPAVLMKDTEDFYYDKISKLVHRSLEENQGDVLIFLPGEMEIKNCVGELEHCPFSKKLQIYPLYGRLSKEEQERVFTPTAREDEGCRLDEHRRDIAHDRRNKNSHRLRHGESEFLQSENLHIRPHCTPDFPGIRRPEKRKSWTHSARHLLPSLQRSQL